MFRERERERRERENKKLPMSSNCLLVDYRWEYRSVIDRGKPCGLKRWYQNLIHEIATVQIAEQARREEAASLTSHRHITQTFVIMFFYL